MHRLRDHDFHVISIWKVINCNVRFTLSNTVYSLCPKPRCWGVYRYLAFLRTLNGIRKVFLRLSRDAHKWWSQNGCYGACTAFVRSYTAFVRVSVSESYIDVNLMTQQMARHVKIACFLSSLVDITRVLGYKTLTMSDKNNNKTGCQAKRKCRGQMIDVSRAPLVIVPANMILWAIVGLGKMLAQQPRRWPYINLFTTIHDGNFRRHSSMNVAIKWHKFLSNIYYIYVFFVIWSWKLR